MRLVAMSVVVLLQKHADMPKSSLPDVLQKQCPCASIREPSEEVAV